jgi:hypothetical protein
MDLTFGEDFDIHGFNYMRSNGGRGERKRTRTRQTPDPATAPDSATAPPVPFLFPLPQSTEAGKIRLVVMG